MGYQRDDVVWGPDPFKSGENPRPWLILNNDTHPFGDEEYMTVTLTTTPTTKRSRSRTPTGSSGYATPELRLSMVSCVTEARRTRPSTGPSRRIVCPDRHRRTGDISRTTSRHSIATNAAMTKRDAPYDVREWTENSDRASVDGIRLATIADWFLKELTARVNR